MIQNTLIYQKYSSKQYCNYINRENQEPALVYPKC
jgi:hypothetical protein